MKRVRVQYFALLREQAKRVEERVETAAATPAALYDELARRHGFTLSVEHIKVAINDEFGTWQAPLADNARVAFIPPIAGG
jgi:molybdopterin converting factor subunit 1